MNITFEGGKLYLGALELGPDFDLSSSQAQEVFQLCRQNQALSAQHSEVDELIPRSGVVNFLMPKSDSNADDNADKVIFFPGSFSPWHKGHLACVLNLPEDKEVIQNLVVLPDFNPWKEVREEGLWPEVQEIWQGLQQAAAQREDLKISLYLGFLADKTANPTVEWLPQAIGTEKWLLMGEDTFLNLHKWKEADKVIGALKGIYVCPRALEEASVLSQREKLLGDYKEELMIEFLKPHPYQNYSSTWARANKK